MAKISIDLKTSSGNLPEKEILIPTPSQVMEAFTGALLTTKLIGKEAATLVEVIKISFSQLCLDETHTKTNSRLELRLTAIMNINDEKFEACAVISLSRINAEPRNIAIELSQGISRAIAARAVSAESSAKFLTQTYKSLIDTSNELLMGPYRLGISGAMDLMNQITN